MLATFPPLFILVLCFVVNSNKRFFPATLQRFAPIWLLKRKEKKDGGY